MPVFAFPKASIRGLTWSIFSSRLLFGIFPALTNCFSCIRFRRVSKDKRNKFVYCSHFYFDCHSMTCLVFMTITYQKISTFSFTWTTFSRNDNTLTLIDEKHLTISSVCNSKDMRRILTLGTISVQFCVLFNHQVVKLLLLLFRNRRRQKETIIIVTEDTMKGGIKSWQKSFRNERMRIKCHPSQQLWQLTHRIIIDVHLLKRIDCNEYVSNVCVDQATAQENGSKQKILWRESKHKR